MARIDVAPVQVVDGQDQGLLPRQPGQQLAERSGGPAPDLELIRALERRRVCVGDGIDVLQYREKPRQKRGILRQQFENGSLGKLLEMAAQGIEQAIERLVRDRLRS